MRTQTAAMYILTGVVGYAESEYPIDNTYGGLVAAHCQVYGGVSQHGRTNTRIQSGCCTA